jgi:hypothetical protein
MHKKKSQRKNARGIANTHIPLTPLFSEESSSGRFLALCTFSHRGIVHPSAFFYNKFCPTCKHVRFYELPYKPFDEKTLSDKIESYSGRRRRIPTISLNRVTFEEERGPCLWYLDRGVNLYLLRVDKREFVPDIEKDHLQLYLDSFKKPNFLNS